MNSLSDLNSYNSSTTFEYTENRVARLLFDRDTPNNQTLTVNEGSTFSSPEGINITDVIDYTTTAATYTINVNSLAGTTVTWPTVPAGCTVTNPSTGVYRISGINTAATWEIVKNPNIVLAVQAPNGFYGDFSYTATIAYTDGELGAQTESWTVAVSVLDVTILLNPLELTFASNATTTITNPATIIDLDTEYPGATWTVVLTPSPNTSVSSIQKTISNNSATFSFNSSTKVLTLSGSRTDVNAYLNALTLTANSVQQDFILTYQATNNQDSAIDTKTQLFRNLDIAYLANPTESTVFYIEDTQSDVNGTPLITDNSYVGAGSYTLTITPASASLVYLMVTAGTGGSSSFNNSTKILTITGTKAEVNSHLETLELQPASDVDSTFVLTYELVTPEANTANKIQQLICNSSDIETSNLTVTRTYQSNNFNTIFATNTPQITDFDSTGTDTYTVILDCNFGDWTYVDGTETALANPTSISGNRSTVNSKIAGIKFYPDAGISSNGTFTWTQLKNGVQQFSQIIPLTGSVGTYSGSRTETFLASGTWTPTLLDIKYGDIKEITVVGGGGGGSFGGGGGGQVKYSSTPISLTATTYTITVGAGGLANFNSNAANGTNSTAFSITALGGGGGYSNGTGGYSYAPDGTQYLGGNPSTINNGGSTAATLKYAYNGGGGAGSGGRNTIFEDATVIGRDEGIDGPDTWGEVTYGRNGGIGYYAPLGGVIYGATQIQYRDGPNFGFGGGGGQLIEITGGGGGLGGYANPSGTFYSRAGQRFYDDYDNSPNTSVQATAAVDSPRTAAVAGGGGAGGVLTALPTNGGDGIVIFRIGTK